MAQEYKALIDTLTPTLAPQYGHIIQNLDRTGLKVLHVITPPPIILAGSRDKTQNRPTTPELGMCMEKGKDISQNAAVLACLGNVFANRALHLTLHSGHLRSTTGNLKKFSMEQIKSWAQTLVDTNLLGFNKEVDYLLDAVSAEALSGVTFPTTQAAKQTIIFFNSAMKHMKEERDLFIQELIDRFSLGFQSSSNLKKESLTAKEFLEHAITEPAKIKKHEMAIFAWIDKVRKAHQEAWLITSDTSNSDLWCLTFHHKPISNISE